MAVFGDDLYAGKGGGTQEEQFFHRSYGAEFLGNLRHVYLGHLSGGGFISSVFFPETSFDDGLGNLEFGNLDASLLSQGVGENTQFRFGNY